MSAGDVEIRKDEPPEGLEELAALPAGCFFHSPAWLRAVRQAEPRFGLWTYATRDVAGVLQAAAPFLVASRLGIVRLYAGAWGTYGGVLGREPAPAAALGRALESLLRSPRIALVRVHDWSGGFEAACGAAPGWRRQQESSQVLDLGADPGALFRDAFTQQNRNKIRKAEKLGVQVRRANDADALQRYAALYRETERRWRRRRRLPSRLFAALASAAGVDVWLAERGGETLAALLNLRGGGQIMNWGNVSRREAWDFAPNNLLHWRAIEAACLDPGGPRLYNFGSSSGLPGVHNFKAAFGAREHAYARLEYVAPWARWARRIG